MDLSFVKEHTLLIGLLLVGGFVLWKFVAQPIMNEGKPIEPDEDSENIIDDYYRNLEENPI